MKYTKCLLYSSLWKIISCKKKDFVIFLLLRIIRLHLKTNYITAFQTVYDIYHSGLVILSMQGMGIKTINN